MATTEREIEEIAKQIWPDAEIKVGDSRSAMDWGDTAPDPTGYAIWVRVGGKIIERIKADTLDDLKTKVAALLPESSKE
jgi:hypothetical protein